MSQATGPAFYALRGDSETLNVVRVYVAGSQREARKRMGAALRDRRCALAYLLSENTPSNELVRLGSRHENVIDLMIKAPSEDEVDSDVDEADDVDDDSEV